MALTVTVSRNDLVGSASSIRMAIGTVTFDNSYPTGGEAFDPTADSDFSPTFTAVTACVIQPLEDVAGGAGYKINFDTANGTLIVTEAGADGAALDEVANATDLSALSAGFMVVGT